MSTTKTCKTCCQPVSTLGTFVQHTMNILEHRSCFQGRVFAEGVQAGRDLLEREQAEAREKARREQEAGIRAEFDALKRCPKCGVRVSANIRDEWRPLGQVNIWDGTSRCHPCIREEVRLRNSAQEAPQRSTQPEAPTPAPEKPKEETKDRFSLLDLD